MAPGIRGNAHNSSLERSAVLWGNFSGFARKLSLQLACCYLREMTDHGSGLGGKDPAKKLVLALGPVGGAYQMALGGTACKWAGYERATVHTTWAAELSVPLPNGSQLSMAVPQIPMFIYVMEWLRVSSTRIYSQSGRWPKQSRVSSILDIP